MVQLPLQPLRPRESWPGFCTACMSSLNFVDLASGLNCELFAKRLYRLSCPASQMHLQVWPTSGGFFAKPPSDPAETDSMKDVKDSEKQLQPIIWVRAVLALLPPQVYIRPHLRSLPFPKSSEKSLLQQRQNSHWHYDLGLSAIKICCSAAEGNCMQLPCTSCTSFSHQLLAGISGALWNSNFRPALSLILPFLRRGKVPPIPPSLQPACTGDAYCNCTAHLKDCQLNCQSGPLFLACPGATAFLKPKAF